MWVVVPVGEKVMLLLKNYCDLPFLLATAGHIVELVSIVPIYPFTAIELISLWGSGPVTVNTVKLIVAIPAVEDILTRAPVQQPVVAVAPVEHVIASLADHEVSALLTVDDVTAVSSKELISTAKAAYLVIAVLDRKSTRLNSSHTVISYA